MAEAAFKQMISSLIRQTRPQTFRHGKPPRYPQRSIATSAATESSGGDGISNTKWNSHSLPSQDTTTTPKPRLQQLRTDSEPRAFSSFLTDKYARQHNYLRISVTERCNLRCLYCMPEEGVPLSPAEHILTTPEIVYLSSLFVDQGVNKIRLTGGEPTVRKDIVDLMQQIGQLRKSGLKELCLTTNGISLYRKLDAMVEAGLTGVNLSLDTTDPFQFTLMTRRNGHEAVMRSIQRILEMNKLGAGIKLKINCVVMRGINEREIIPFVEMGKDQDLEVRFIEYMPFDGNKWSQKKMISFKEMLAMIQSKYPNVHKVQGHANDTSKTYQVPGFVGRMGFITSMTHNFCGTCNRLRITSDGNLKVCLFGNSEVSLRDILRQSNEGKPIDSEAMEAIKQIEMDHRNSQVDGSEGFGLSAREARLLDVIGMAVQRKKAKHAGMGELENMRNRPMILIEGLDGARNSSIQHSSYHLIQHAASPSPLSTGRTSTIPLHLLHSHRSLEHLRFAHSVKPQPFRHFSTRRFRTVKGASTYRRINHDFSDRNDREGEKQAWKSDKPILTKIKQPLSHLNAHGEAHMVDISDKAVTSRFAVACASLAFSHPNTFDVLKSSTLSKGDALAVARIAAITAAKKTSDLIPLTHPALKLTSIKIWMNEHAPRNQTVARQGNRKAPGSRNLSIGINSSADCGSVTIFAKVACHGRTGVEMEALTAAMVGALTLFDMLKGVDKGMSINGARVLEKAGGKSGHRIWDPETSDFKIVSNPNGSSEEQQSSNPILAGTKAGSTSGSTTDLVPRTALEPDHQQHEEGHTEQTASPTNLIATGATARGKNKQKLYPSQAAPMGGTIDATNEHPNRQALHQEPSIEVMYKHDHDHDHDSGRVNAAGFETKRMERYEEWTQSR